MDLAALFKPIEALPISGWVRENDFSFPLLECVHVASVMIVVGSITMVDLRLVGLTSKGRAVTRLSHEVLPWTWVAFAIAAVSGCILMTGQAAAYAVNPQFQGKMLLMLAAAVNMAVFHFVTWRSVDQWDTRASPPPLAKAAGFLSLGFWIGVVVLGRWVGWTLVG